MQIFLEDFYCIRGKLYMSSMNINTVLHILEWTTNRLATLELLLIESQVALKVIINKIKVFP